MDFVGTVVQIRYPEDDDDFPIVRVRANHDATLFVGAEYQSDMHRDPFPIIGDTVRVRTLGCVVIAFRPGALVQK